MRRIVDALWLPALLISSLLSVAIIDSPRGNAQQASCLGNNICEAWNNSSNGVVTAHCVALLCSQSRGSGGCRIQNNERIPSSCGAGSYFETPSFICSADRHSANTSYFCNATSLSVSIQAMGPTCGVAPERSDTDATPHACRRWRRRPVFCKL